MSNIIWSWGYCLCWAWLVRAKLEIVDILYYSYVEYLMLEWLILWLDDENESLKLHWYHQM